MDFELFAQVYSSGKCFCKSELHIYSRTRSRTRIYDMEDDNQLLTCAICDTSYCEKCGKEVSIPTLINN